MGDVALRILIATFGSAGDVFPVVPVADRLAGFGHKVIFAAPRAQALFLRAQGRQVVSLGRGEELKVLHDERVVTTRFSGWASWRTTTADYVAPALAADVAVVERVIERWRPDVVVTLSFAAAARVAAYRQGVPQVRATIYPQHVMHLPDSRCFGRDLRVAIGGILRADPGADVVGNLAWGVASPLVLLHDAALLRDLRGNLAPVGFPSWDGAHPGRHDEERVVDWCATGDGPVVMVTLGSFLGVRQRAVWSELVDGVRALGMRALLVGGAGAYEPLAQQEQSVLATRYVRHSAVLAGVDAVVHHGGIGTMFAVMRAARPAVIVPQAFDQRFNAELVERVGVGVDGGRQELKVALKRVVEDDALRERAELLAGWLVPVDEAAESAADTIVRSVVGVL